MKAESPPGGVRIAGNGVAKDAARGMALPEDAAKTEAEARALRGTIYGADAGLPKDGARGLEPLEGAADAGSAVAIHVLGSNVLVGAEVPRAPARARATPERAAAFGRQSAWSRLAISAMSKRLGAWSIARFDEPATTAPAAGDPRIVVYEAERELRGAGAPKNATSTLKRMETSAEADSDRAIAERVIGLYRRILRHGVAEPFSISPRPLEGKRVGSGPIGRLVAETKDAEAVSGAGAAALPIDTDVQRPQSDTEARARHFFDMAIKAGDVKAMRLLGEALIAGKGMAKDAEEGRALLEEAAKTDAQAKATLGAIYLTGAGLPRDEARGVELLEAAADAGEATAMHVLGASFLAGTAVPRDPARARVYLERAGEAGDTAALRLLGQALVNGDGLPRNIAKGVELLQVAARSDPSSQLLLGEMYLDGTHVPKDIEAARGFLERAAAGGNGSALEILGTGHLVGRDLPFDPQRAEDLLRRAIAAGDGRAVRHLGLALLEGQVLDKDAAEGLRLLQGASDRGDRKATLLLGQIFLRGETVPQDLARATALFEALAAEGDGKGLQILGENYLWGTYTSARAEKAEEYLTRAAELGRSAAWSALANGAVSKRLGARSLARFDEFAAKARAAGDPRIVVYEAERELRGAGVRQSVKGALARLQAAAEAGNDRAAERLIGLYREGRRKLVDKDLKRAEAYLRDYAEILSDYDAGLQRFLLDVAAARSLASDPTGEFEALLGDGANAAYLEDVYAQGDILDANANFSVYRIQKILQAGGLYDGPLDGLLKRRTLRAMQSACLTLAIAQRCKRKLVTGDVFARLALGWRFFIENY